MPLGGKFHNAREEVPVAVRYVFSPQSMMLSQKKILRVRRELFYFSYKSSYLGNSFIPYHCSLANKVIQYKYWS